MKLSPWQTQNVNEVLCDDEISIDISQHLGQFKDGFKFSEQSVLTSTYGGRSTQGKVLGTQYKPLTL